MKPQIFLVIFVILCSAGNAQDEGFDRNIRIGAYASAGMNQPIRLIRKYVTEDVGPFHGEESWSAGLKFSGMISQNMRIEFAAGYSVHKAGFELSPPVYPESKIYPETIRTYNLPVTLYRYLTRNFFIRAGTIIDFELDRRSYWIDSQNGIGFTAGAGTELHAGNFFIDIAPNLELHSLIPFNEVMYQQRLLVFELKLGLGYCFRERIKKESNGTLSTTNF